VSFSWVPADAGTTETPVYVGCIQAAGRRTELATVRCNVNAPDTNLSRRHSRAGGNPCVSFPWVPAYAGTTARCVAACTHPTSTYRSDSIARKSNSWAALISPVLGLVPQPNRYHRSPRHSRAGGNPGVSFPVGCRRHGNDRNASLCRVHPGRSLTHRTGNGALQRERTRREPIPSSFPRRRESMCVILLGSRLRGNDGFAVSF
jgi:hypothetical protein